MNDPFVTLCESLWRDWLDDRLPATVEIARRFDLAALPEPYLRFGGDNPLYVLTTNPGGTLPQQRRAAVLAGQSPAQRTMSYAEVARAFAAHYEQTLKGPARTRIRAFRRLAEGLNLDGVFQVEACPFHSSSLPGKDFVVDLIAADPQLARYAEAVRTFLRTRPTVILSAISTREALGPGLRLSRWLEWQVGLVGLDMRSTRFVPLIEKGGRPTCGAFVSGHGSDAKALVLMMGGNHLPGEQGLARLAAGMRSLG